MTVLLMGLFLLMAYNSKIYFKGQNKDYISKDGTAAVKGCFLILVFVCHLTQYITAWNNWDFVFLRFTKGLGQLVVAMFLFYSGYGVTLSAKNKGIDYVKRIPKHRFLSVLIQFDIAVLLFLITKLILGWKFSLKTTLLSLIGWSSLGNSNWYIFAILVLYLISFLSFFIFRKSPVCSAALSTVLIAALVLGLKQCKEYWWYDTLICYAMGIWFAVLKDPIENLLSKKYVTESLLLLFAAAFFISYRYIHVRFLCYEISAVLFTVMILLFTRKVSVQNRVIKYLGDHLFSLYILQRLPMIFLFRTPLLQHKVLFSLVCAAITLILGYVFDKLTPKLIKALKL